MRRFLFSICFAVFAVFGLSLPLQAETVIWEGAMLHNINNGSESNGVRINGSGMMMGEFDTGDYSFSTSLGTFSRIEVETSSGFIEGSGWNYSNEKFVWNGSASNVSFTVSSEIHEIDKITFSIDVPSSGTCGDNLTWEYDKDSYTLTISGSGNMYNYDSNSTPWTSYKNSIQRVVLSEGVQSIGNHAFDGFSSLSSINFPEGLQSIGTFAFDDCSSLVSLEFPSTLTTIEQHAFPSCTGLQTIVLPASLNYIDHYVFKQCTGLQYVYVNWTSLDGLSLGTNPFFFVNTSNVTLIVPPGTKSMYAGASPWSGFKIIEGALPGKFSISASQQIRFSVGNLQYQASADKWRFAEHQYDYVGEGNLNKSGSYTGWIDLFGWGTGADPTLNSDYYGDYYSFTDWGINPISNGGNTANIWRTLTQTEWAYVTCNRLNAGSLFGLGNIDGTNGAILLPDDWITPDGVTFVPGARSGGLQPITNEWPKFRDDEDTERNHFEDNTYTAEQWAIMEEAGAVFLPAAGILNQDGSYGDKSKWFNERGFYKSSTSADDVWSGQGAYTLFITNREFWAANGRNRAEASSVRLVQNLPSATITTAPTAKTDLVANGSAQTLINAGTASGGTVYYKLGDSEWSTDLPTATEAGEYTVYYKVVGDENHADFTPAGNSIAVNIKTTVYLVPGVWATGEAKFAAYVWDEGKEAVWSDIMTPTADGKAYKTAVNKYAKIIFVRLKNTATTPNWNDKWNQTNDLTFASNNCYQITGWGGGDGRWRNYPFYYVQFQDYNETVLKRDTIDHGNAATPPADPTRTGYTFTGWDAEYDNITSDLTVTAQYEINKYTITWKDGDGKTLETDENVPYGAIPSYDGVMPTKTATAQYTYSFNDNWSPDVVTVTGDATYTAQFDATLRFYDVFWWNWDNELLGMNTVPYGEMPSYDLETPAKEGDEQYSYTFAGWTPALTSVTGDVSYKATFNQVVNKYTITWKDGDGATLKSEEIEFGDFPVYTGDTPTKTATAQYTYSFNDSWSPDIMPVMGNSTYTAQFDATPKSYTLAWNAAGGELSGDYTDGTTAYGTTIVAPTATRTGYSFDGWDAEVAATMPAANTTYTAQWTEIKHDVAVEAGANGLVSVAKVENIGIATASGDITATANTGYHFVNWTLPAGVTLAEGFALTDATIQIHATADEKTITANFAVTAYTLAWELAGGEVKTAGTAAGSVNYGTALIAPIVEKTGYTFKGWTPEVAATMPAADATYTATWTINQYTISFNSNGGTEVDAIQQNYGTEVTAPDAPTRTGYTFTGWSPELPATMPAENIELTAQWTEIKHDVAVEAGSNGLVSVAKVENIGIATASGNITATANTGYHFVNWTLPAGVTLAEGFALTDATIQIHATADEKTITANFAVTAYTLAWELAGGEVKTAGTAAGSVNYGTALIAPIVEKTGYTFKGWTPEVAATMPAADATYTATWTINQYTISFNSNGGTEVDAIQQNYGTEVTAPDAPTRTGYTFAGWSPELPETMPAENIELTAQWTINKYTITWLMDDNTEIDHAELEYGAVPTHADPTKAATAQYTYTFTGWTPAVVAVTSNATYKATFSSTVNSYVITFKDEDGTVLSEEEWKYGEMPDCDEPTKAADAHYTYTFSGWSPEVTAVTGEATYTATYEATEKPYIPTAIPTANDQILTTKVLIDQHVYIIRDGRTYTVTGQEVRMTE